MLTEAARGRQGRLPGGSEGERASRSHLVPAGTGFHMHQEAEVKLNAPQIDRRAEPAAEAESGVLAPAGKAE